MNLSHASQAYVKPQTEPTTHRTPTQGARSFCSILNRYMCRTGTWAGWTKFSDTDKLKIVNRHLVEDGKRAISRATYYRWKSDARAAGLLDFKSTARRLRDRKRQASGLWMRVLTVPTSSQCTGRRPRRATLDETPCAPPLHETPCAPYKEEIRDLSSQRDQGKERASSNGVAKIKAAPAVKAPALVPSGSRDQETQGPGQRQNQNHHDGKTLANIEARLDKRAAECNAAPTDPKPGRRFDIRDALARGHTADELVELVAVAVEDPWGRKQKDKYWGDVVAHAMKHSKKYQAKYQARGRVETSGGCASDVEREAMIGARPEDGTEDQDGQELVVESATRPRGSPPHLVVVVESDDDVQPTTEQRTNPPVEETVEEVEPRISWGEYLHRHPELKNTRRKA